MSERYSQSGSRYSQGGNRYSQGGNRYSQGGNRYSQSGARYSQSGGGGYQAGQDDAYKPPTKTYHADYKPIRHERDPITVPYEVKSQDWTSEEFNPLTKEILQDIILPKDPENCAAWNNLGVFEGGTVQGVAYDATACFVMALEIEFKYSPAWQNLACAGGGEVNGQGYAPKQCIVNAIEGKRAETQDLASCWAALSSFGGHEAVAFDDAEPQPYSMYDCAAKALERSYSNKGDEKFLCAAYNNLGVWGGGQVREGDLSQKRCFERALECNPDSYCAWANAGAIVGGITLNERDYSSRECYETSIKLSLENAPPDEDGYIPAWRGLAYGDGGDVNGSYKSKKECIQLVLKEEPDDSKCWLALAEAGGGEIVRRLDDGEDVTEEFDMMACLTKVFEKDEGGRVMAIGWTNAGVEFSKPERGGDKYNYEGDSYDSKECYEKAVGYDPSYSTAWINLGVMGGGKHDGEDHDKVSCYQKGLECNEKDGNGWVCLGIACGGVVNGHRVLPKECFIKALELMSISHVNNVISALAWNGLSQTDGGIVDNTHYDRVACVVKSLEYNDQSWAAWMNLAYSGGGDVSGHSYDRVAACVKAIDLDPSKPAGWNNLGIYGGGTVDGEEYTAKQCFIKTLELDPENSKAWTNLGMLGGGEVSGTSYSKTVAFGKAVEYDSTNVVAQKHYDKFYKPCVA